MTRHKSNAENSIGKRDKTVANQTSNCMIMIKYTNKKILGNYEFNCQPKKLYFSYYRISLLGSEASNKTFNWRGVPAISISKGRLGARNPHMLIGAEPMTG